MEPRLARRFSLLDAMALVAATAVGLALHRAFWSEAPPFVQARDPRGILLRVMIFLTPLAAMWTAAVLALSTRPRQRRWRRVFLRPGAAVCCAAVSALVVGIAVLGFGLGAGSPYFLISSLMLFGLPTTAGATVVSTWILLILVQGYRPSADWADRLGRLLGLYWMAWLPILAWSLVGP